MDKPRNVFYFGDSMMGQHLRTGWAYLHFQALQEADPKLRILPLIYGGSNSHDVLEKMYANIRFGDEKGISKIFIGVGIVDSSMSRKHVDIETFEDNIRRILDLGKKHTREVVGVGLTRLESPEVVSPRTENIYREDLIGLYDRAFMSSCANSGALYVPMYNVLSSGDYLDDGLHPNERGSDKMSEKVLSFVGV